MNIPSLRPTARKPNGLAVEFLTRRGGTSPVPYNDLNLGNRVGDEESNVQRNFELVDTAFGIRPGHLKVLHQVHGNRILVAGMAKSENGTAEPEADGWITDQPGLFIGIRTADCLPILAWDAQRGIVGAAHAGWRGTHAGIAGELVNRFGRDFGCRPSDLHFALGPAIGPCCYHVGKDLLDTIGTAGKPFLYEARGFVSVDLWAWNRSQLVSAGVEPKSIEAISFCTSCTPDQFFSNRRDGPRTGRQLSFIGLS
ncbi:MAG: peptidoglycan editing factor PgeF [Nitrospirae bacterium]|nr:peptidoglycan editing factor PgeF [Nitrospirota bacterium]